MRIIVFLLIAVFTGAVPLLAGLKPEDIIANQPVAVLLVLIILLALLLALIPKHVRDDAALIAAIDAQKERQEQDLTKRQHMHIDVQTLLNALDERVQGLALPVILPELMHQLAAVPEVNPQVVETLKTVHEALPLARSMVDGTAALQGCDFAQSASLLTEIFTTVQGLGTPLSAEDLATVQTKLETLAALQRVAYPARIEAPTLDARLEVFQKVLSIVVNDRFGDYETIDGFKRVYLQVFNDIAKQYAWDRLNVSSTEYSYFRAHIARRLNNCSGWDDFGVDGPAANFIGGLFIGSNRT